MLGFTGTDWIDEGADEDQHAEGETLPLSKDFRVSLRSRVRGVEPRHGFGVNNILLMCVKETKITYILSRVQLGLR